MICLKKVYEKPQILLENFALTQQIAKCHGVQISSTDRTCVFKDPDSTPEMKILASAGAFIANSCAFRPDQQQGDGLCYFQNVHMVFTS